MPETPDIAWAATLAQFVVNVPNAHPFWAYWMVGVVHLRAIPGTAPPRLKFEGATHEFLIAALNPERGVPDVDGGPLFYLEPVDVVEQFAGASDDQAAQLCAGAVRAICDGRISPDSDYRRLWREVVKASLQHIVLGAHPKERT